MGNQAITCPWHTHPEKGVNEAEQEQVGNGVRHGNKVFSPSPAKWRISYVGASAALFLGYGVRCPQCRNPIGYLMYLPGGGWFGFSKKLNFCPFCGLDLNGELKSVGA